MMGLSILDWVIVLVIVLSVLQAIAEGFFYEFFALAGVVVGYLLAAWEYPRVAAWYAPYVNSQWAADIAGFFTIFFVVAAAGRIAGTDRALGGQRRGTALVRPLSGRCVRVCARRCCQHGDRAGAGGFRSTVGASSSRGLAPLLLVAGRALIWAAPADLRQRFWTGWDLLRTVPEHVPRNIATATDREELECCD